LCAGEACVGGEPRNCNDGNVCTFDSCEPAIGCVYQNNDLPCDDGSVCTLNDYCAGGTCIAGEDDTCSDDVFCNGKEVCDPALGCVSGEPPNTNDGIDCTVDSCDEANDKVLHIENDAFCATGGLCKNDYCDAVVGCISNLKLDCCGNSIVEAPEECDNGVANADAPNVCRTNCKLPACPDGIVDAGEECDDGNNNNGDTCKNDCTKQTQIKHFDGFNFFYNNHPVDIHSSARAIDACQNYWGQTCSVKGCGGAKYVISNQDVNCNNSATKRIWYWGVEGCGYT